MARELTIYCDESSFRGRFFSNFYGGVLIESRHLENVRRVISQKKADLNLFGEVKWTKIAENYSDKYIDLIDTFFDLVEQGKIKVRIMFTQNMFVPTGLTRAHEENKYFLLYYQFLKHAFGLRHAVKSRRNVYVRIYLDKLPDTKDNVSRFREYVARIPYLDEFESARIRIRNDDIAEVVSHEHDILQCLDVVLGSMDFRLNDKHKAIPEGKKRRAKRTVAKHKVYKRIYDRIKLLRKGFNPGITTGTDGDVSNHWIQSYRHWEFRASNYEVRGVSKKKAP